MATLTIRNLDDSLKARLRGEAARHGRSMEEEVRQILRERLAGEPQAEGPVTQQHRRITAIGGAKLESSSPEQPLAEADLRQRREEAARWYESYRRQVLAEQSPEASLLSDDDVNALVHELR
jgi:antitoxin FitA